MAKKSGIHIKKSKKGSLHTALGVKKGDKIPASKLKIKSTDSPALKKKKQFAINAKKFKHQAGGPTDEAGQFIDQYNQQNDIAAGLTGPGSNFQPIQNAGASAQQNGLIGLPQQQYNLSPETTNSSVDLQQYLKTPQGQQNAKKYKKMGYEITGFDPNGKPTFAKINKVVTGPNKGVELFNGAASIATGIADVIHENDQRADEYRKVIKNVAPRFMENMESEGLNNMPAYTMYGGRKKMGGPIAHGEPVGVVDFDSGSGLDDAMYEGIRHSGPYGQSMVYSGNLGRYAAGGHVSAEKAKEILRDGTAQGHPLTAKQKRYFGWLAGGGKAMGGFVPTYQTGGQPGPNPSPVNPQADQSDTTDDYYKANATLQYFKTQLNNKLRAKDPEAYDKFQSGFGDINNQYRTGKLQPQQLVPTRQAYVQNSDYNIALSPEDVQGALGDQYQTYLNSLQTVNKYNIQKGQQPLYGTIEGDQDVTKLNYGRRFASVTTNPSIDATLKKASGAVERRRKTYSYDPTQQKVNLSEVMLDDNGVPIQQPASGQGGSRQTGGVIKNDATYVKKPTPRQIQYHDEMHRYVEPEHMQTHEEIHRYLSAPKKSKKQAGGYSVGQELNLSSSQIKALKKQGYKIEEC